MNELGNELGNEFIYQGSTLGSLAEKSELQIGDRFLSLNGITLMNLDDWDKGLNVDRTKRVIEVLRGNEILNITIYCTNNKSLN